MHWILVKLVWKNAVLRPEVIMWLMRQKLAEGPLDITGSKWVKLCREILLNQEEKLVLSIPYRVRYVNITEK